MFLYEKTPPAVKTKGPIENELYFIRSSASRDHVHETGNTPLTYSGHLAVTMYNPLNSRGMDTVSSTQLTVAQ